MKGGDRARATVLVPARAGRQRTPLVGFPIATLDGRTLLMRPAGAEEGVQLAIVSTYGNVVDAVTLRLDQVPAAIFTLDAVSEIAWRAHERLHKRRRRERQRRHAAALAANPWSRKPPRRAEESYIGREVVV